jgi:hypothetical protein
MANPNQIMALAVFILAASRGGAQNNQPSVKIPSSYLGIAWFVELGWLTEPGR